MQNTVVEEEWVGEQGPGQPHRWAVGRATPPSKGRDGWWVLRHLLSAWEKYCGPPGTEW